MSENTTQANWQNSWFELKADAMQFALQVQMAMRAKIRVAPAKTGNGFTVAYTTDLGEDRPSLMVSAHAYVAPVPSGDDAPPASGDDAPAY